MAEDAGRVALIAKLAVRERHRSTEGKQRGRWPVTNTVCLDTSRGAGEPSERSRSERIDCLVAIRSPVRNRYSTGFVSPRT